MKLNHINLVVSNVADAIVFFETYFTFKCTSVKGENSIAVLKGSDDFTLVIMKNKEDDLVYPSAFHIGFMPDSEDNVMQTYHKLKSGGFAGLQEPKKIRGSFGFYFTYQNLLIEVGYYFDE